MPEALQSATDWLLAQQSPEGWWSGELETNVTMTAEHVLLLRFLGADIRAIAQGAVKHFLVNQRDDGSWALYYDGPADLSTTIEAYVALKVLGFDPSAPEMRRALAMIQRLGGLAKARVFTKIWLALFGKYPWDGIPSLPPELVFFPPSMPFNFYDFACWARGTIAPLCVVIARRPVRELGIDIPEIVVNGTQASMHRVPGSGAFWWLDQVLKLYEHSPWRPTRNNACRRVTDWVVERQEADGSWGGIQPPWVYSLIALSIEGRNLDDPVMKRGLLGAERFVMDDDARGWRFQACMSPVWDTAWAVRALRAANFSPREPVMQRAIQWMLDEQIPAHAPGDWRIRVKGVDCGGWAFEFDNDAYPDVDDTTIVVLALLEGGEREKVEAAVQRAIPWTLAMRSGNGAWAAFDRDNEDTLVYRMPFADFGALIDPPTEDVTAHVLEMLAAVGYGVDDPYVAGGLRYLRRTQRPSGAWYGRWGVNYIYGTWCVLSSLTALRTGDDMVRRAAAWLLERQNRDGGWGETCHSYEDESFAGVGDSAPSQTAWALLSLQIASLTEHDAYQRGMNYLVERQRSDGTWDEPQYTGTGFPGDFYINYHLYRHLFPMMALAHDAALRGRILVPEGAAR
ncbi:MAG: squalene--hopene cyclase [Candidatus Eremiobacteraeota bacterium]|nr:squalene--hopene cyclase [Candidatus Eremiobacteraeota bacterium]